MRLTSPKVHFSKTIHEWHRPLRIVPYRAIIYASFSKRSPMTVTLSNFVDAINVLFTCLYYMTEGGGFLGWTLEWFQRLYIIVMPCLCSDLLSKFCEIWLQECFGRNLSPGPLQ